MLPGRASAPAAVIAQRDQQQDRGTRHRGPLPDSPNRRLVPAGTGKRRNPIVGQQPIITDPLRGSTWGSQKLSRMHADKHVPRDDSDGADHPSRTDRMIDRTGAIVPSDPRPDWKNHVAKDEVIDTIGSVVVRLVPDGSIQGETET